MKKKMFVTALIMALMSGCTENQKAKSFGGNGEIELPVGQKLINATWKDDNLWYLTRPMVSTDTAAVYTFHEESSFGVMEGTYTIKEVK